MPSTSQFLMFDNFQFNVATRELVRASDVGPAIPIPLGSRAADLLLLLLRRPGELVTKKEIVEAVWPNAVVEESNLPVQISALRRALDAGRSGASSIQTVPGRGYRFTLRVTTGDTVARDGDVGTNVPARLNNVSTPIHAVGPAFDTHEPIASKSTALERRVVAPGRTWPIALIAACIAAPAFAAGLYFASMLPRGPTPVVTGKFDASIVPLVDDRARRALANYPTRPDKKALAISIAGYGMALGVADIESAKQEALQRCLADSKIPCRLYAIGTDVIWPRTLMPLPVDMREASVGVPLLAAQLPMLNDNQREIVQGYIDRAGHKALALGAGRIRFVAGRDSREEAVRLAVEQCTDVYQVPCLLVSVDGFLTVQIPKSYRVTQIFTLAGELEMSEQDKQRIGRIYQGPEWRALARGRDQNWHAVAGAASEAAAVDGALRSCREHNPDCRLYAIGNFLVDASVSTGQH